MTCQSQHTSMECQRCRFLLYAQYFPFPSLSPHYLRLSLLNMTSHTNYLYVFNQFKQLIIRGVFRTQPRLRISVAELWLLMAFSPNVMTLLSSQGDVIQGVLKQLDKFSLLSVIVKQMCRLVDTMSMSPPQVTKSKSQKQAVTSIEFSTENNCHIILS